MATTDLYLISECRKNDRRAQMQLYNTYCKRVYNSCLRIFRNAQDAEDAMQDSFLKAFANLDKYEQSMPFAAWITRIAVNTSIDKLRKKDIEVIDFNENIGSAHIVDADDNEDWDRIINKVDEVKAAIDKLPESSRIIINLYLIEGYDHDEIAEILNVAAGTVRVKYMRAKQRLVELIQNKETTLV